MVRTFEITKKGIYLSDFRKSADGYHWGICEITSWNPLKLFDFIKNAKYEHNQELHLLKTMYEQNGSFFTPKNIPIITRDVSLFIENMKLDSKFNDLTRGVTVLVSDVKKIKEKPTAYYRFVFQDDIKNVKERMKEIQNYFITCGAEIR